MCYYSMESKANRPAKVGEELEIRSGHGFSAPGEPDVAVCLRPGTEISVKGAFRGTGGYPSCECDPCRRWKSVVSAIGGQEFEGVATVALRDDDINLRDVLELPGGIVIPITWLRGDGLTTAKVLQVPPDAKEAPPAIPAAASPFVTPAM